MAPVTTPLSLSARQGAFYCLVYIGIGATLPFMPLWFEANGMSAGQIGVILAVPLLMRAFTGPVVGLWADGFALYRTPMIFMGAAGIVFFALMLPGAGWGDLSFWVFVLLWLLGYSTMTTVNPLMDAMTMTLSRERGFNFGVPRGMGSAAFVVTNIGVGYWIQLTHPGVILWTVLLSMAGVALGARYLLPAYPREVVSHSRAPNAAWSRLRGMIRHPGYLPLLIAVSCLQAAHSFYYAFSTLIWKGAGISESVCGWLWAVGVLAEIAFMTFGEKLRRQLGPWRLLLLAGVFSVVRWGAMAFGPDLAWLWGLQALHVLSFAATYMAGLELVQQLTPKGDEALGQTVNAAYSNGVFMGIGTLASGGLYMALGAGGYGVMAAVAVLGLTAAVWLYGNRQRLTAQAS